MHIKVLFPDCGLEKEILDLSNDSRNVSENNLFIAHTGFEVDVHQYIPEAYEKGCRYFVVDRIKAYQYSLQYTDAHFFFTDNLQAEASRIILTFYGHPDKKLTIVGITGTNGKTTCATLIDKTLQKLGYDTAFFGTVEWHVGTKVYPALNTTPDLLTLVQYLKQAVDQGVKYVIMEIASHALAMGRVEGIAFDIAGFTNLTQDHLDFHGNIEQYFHAKKELFTTHLQNSSKHHKAAFINIDDPYGQRIVSLLEGKSIFVQPISLHQKGMWNAQNIRSFSDHTLFDIHYFNNSLEVWSPLIGIFNVYNYMMACMILLFLGIPAKQIFQALSVLSIEGRMQKVLTPKGVVFLVDYAHTPDALENVVQTVKKIVPVNKKSIVVFGAGGDRDPSKRPLMASAASKADVVIVTSDNPRTEDPQKIINDVLKGMIIHKNVHVEPDRKKAIQLAYEIADLGDIVLLAGKGHENYQIIGQEKIHFSDIEEVKNLS